MKITFTSYPVKPLKIIVVIIFISLGFCSLVTAQTSAGFEEQSLKDTLLPHRTVPPPKKHPTRRFIELGFAEIIPFSFDRFVANKDYARISFKTIGDNLHPKTWAWDDDPFETNQFGHPFHGSIFFNTFRSNGYTFWQSVPASIAGSAFWELTAENQPPAFNDFINTSFGGIVLGEMTYRLSNKLINENRGGFRRQASEVLGLIINPANGLNRILDGKWGHVSKTKDPDSAKVSMEVDLGFRRFNSDNTNFLDKGNSGIFGHIKLLYGTPDREYETPFSNIVINVEAGKDDSSKVNTISVYGSLAGWEIKSTEKVQHIVVLSANYDFIHNQAFFYGGQSVKANLLSEYDLTDKTKINTVFGAGPILLSAIPDPYLHLKGGRNYDYGMGFGINASGTLTLDDQFDFNINYRGGLSETVNGRPSHYLLHTVAGAVSAKLTRDISLSAESGYLHLHGSYQKYPDVTHNYPYVKISTRYTINF